ncbi:MAG: hypothetical protein M1113_03535 [Candidatus Thermoplasmatota archaeon]|nr:hypothetical protein [Candidatus Thermoplasmatota archaeon]
MPTIRITDKTWKELNRVAKEFIEYKRIGFEDVLRVSPDDTIKRLIEDWDMTDKWNLMHVEEDIRSGELDKQLKGYYEKIKKQKEEGTYIDYEELIEDIEKEARKQTEAGMKPDIKKIINDKEKAHLEKAKANAKKEGKTNKESEK